jgi:fatty-acyl-CoA synthase
MYKKERVTQKLSYWHTTGAEPLLNLTVGQLLDRAVERWGDKVAFVSLYQGHSITYREARDKADRLAAGLLQLGLSHGDRLGIWGPNSTEWYISRLAASRAGLIAVQIDPAYQGPQLLHSINKVDVKALICAEFYKTNSCYQILRSVIPELDGYPESGVEIKGSKTPSLRTLVIMSDKHYRGAYRLQDVIASANPETLTTIRELQAMIRHDEPCAIQFTSGTTGSPKAAVLSHYSIVNTSMVAGRRWELSSEESKLAVMTQFCHTAGIILGIIMGLCHGVTLFIPAPVFDARKTLECIVQEKCTHVFATPSLWVELIATSHELGTKVTSLQVASCGAAPSSPQLASQIMETFNLRQLSMSYGMTETSVILISLPGEEFEHALQAVGHVADHVEVKIVDKEGCMVPMGTPGELCVRGHGVMLGYWNDEEKTREFMDSDGWAKTGDQFVLQEDGYGRMVGRLKDIIIRIGDKIFPKEIEDLFMEHPDVLEVQAFGVPDPKVGEEISVFLRLRQGATLTEQDVRDYFRDKVAEYRIPRYIRFVKDFERTVIGKVQKYRLLEQLQQELNTKH